MLFRSADEMLGYYRDMMLIRRFEEKAGQLYGMGLIGGFCHLYIGQEAVVVGLQACAKLGDAVITRSEERRVGNECVSMCRFRWLPFHYKQNNAQHTMIITNETDK